ncbi:aminoacyl-tRNA hydrolase [Candidatus Saganbacteria bacterium]|nr:aminoacyl-tRNA hydrolase [Candidatus Saganbacteria bacterium]
MYLIAGLGNPGPKYINTRHNIGFIALEALSKDLGYKELKFKHKCDSFILEANYSGKKLILAEPQTFMNNSGIAVSKLLNFYKIEKAHLIVIYDDLDLEVGTLRIKESGSSGGHKGVDSIIQNIGTSEFSRIRIGIGRDSHFADMADYVLSRIPNEQSEILSNAAITASDAVQEIISNGIASAMNKYNR